MDSQCLFKARFSDRHAWFAHTLVRIGSPFLVPTQYCLTQGAAQVCISSCWLRDTGCFQFGASRDGASVSFLAQVIVWTCFCFSWAKSQASYFQVLGEVHVSFCKDLILTRVLGLPQSMEIDQRPDKKSRRGFTGAPTPLAGVGTTNQVPLPASFLRRGQAGSLHGLSIGACPGVRPEGVFSCLPTTPVFCVQGACTVPCFCSW